MPRWCDIPIAYPIDGASPVIEPTFLQGIIEPHVHLFVALGWFIWLSTLFAVVIRYILIPLWHAHLR